MSFTRGASKRALLIVSPELLADGLGPLFDHGLKIVRSMELSGPVDGCAFIISGHALPETCAPQWVLQEVKITLSKEAYGKQSIVRVSGIELTGRVAKDLVVNDWDRVHDGRAA